MAERKRTNLNLQNTTQKTKDRATGTPLKTVGGTQVLLESSSSCFTSGTCRAILHGGVCY